MITIDGSYLEGGGQIVRTALALAAVTGRECKITNIRKGRPNPGLQEQHLQAVNAMKQAACATVSGDSLGSSELVFRPNGTAYGPVKINISTAGSVGLVLQPLMVVACVAQKPIAVEVVGGATNAKWAAPVNYIRYVLLPLLRKIGYRGDIEVKKYGYYPKGGAHVFARFEPAKLEALDITERGKIVSVGGISHASSVLGKAHVAERQKEACVEELKKLHQETDIDIHYSDTLCPGSGVDLFVRTEHSIIGASSLGEKNVKAEHVGRSAAAALKECIVGAVDEHAGDQLLPYMALAGSGAVRVARVSDHARTNIWVIEQFLPVKFSVKGNVISCRSEN